VTVAVVGSPGSRTRRTDTGMSPPPWARTRCSVDFRNVSAQKSAR